MDKAESDADLIYSFADNRTEALKFNDSGHKKYLQVDFDDAIADFTKAIEIDPELAVAYFNRATVLYRLGSYDLAIKDFAKAVQLQPRNPEFLEGLKDCESVFEETKSLA